MLQIQTNLVLRQPIQTVAHTGTMREGVDVEVSELVVLGKMHHGQCMDRLVGHVEIAFVLQIAFDILDIVDVRAPELAHAVQQRDQGAPQMLADQ